ncbi:AzlC family ABC transporter permease [Lysinibacter cavernae]|uniref:4-azaleucine resistance transporter AzlC n=1 Tax=Lysinibacter cavernae TaxID=1640652 RepID=A0A7X5QZ42_9MICO|nr:AzlC family ABC transporter permease [Lysinibacter cavernae]NIH52505.1 4-azaleucine resistance transporter AzlC [Lysinibacter cavernae]
MSPPLDGQPPSADRMTEPRLRRAARRHEILLGFRDASTAGFAMVPLGIAFGLLVAQSPLDWWWTPIISIGVYAGSLEFLAVGLLVVGTPLLTIAVTTFLVNFRHVFYSLTFPLDRVRGKWARFYSMYSLTDEAYALTAVTDRSVLTSTRILSMQFFCQFYWVIGGLIGVLIGEALPFALVGIDFALTALFAVLTLDAFWANRDIGAPLLAALSAAVALLVAPGQMLVVAMGLFVLLLIVRYLVSGRRVAAAAMDSGVAVAHEPNLDGVNNTDSPLGEAGHNA